MLQDYNKFGIMCLLFSEGEHLFAYRDIKGMRDLCFTERKSPYGEVSLEDNDWQVNLKEEKSPSQKGVVIATKGLTKNEEWKTFGEGELMVFKNGEIVFSDIYEDPNFSWEDIKTCTDVVQYISHQKLRFNLFI